MAISAWSALLWTLSNLSMIITVIFFLFIISFLWKRGYIKTIIILISIQKCEYCEPLATPGPPLKPPVRIFHTRLGHIQKFDYFDSHIVFDHSEECGLFSRTVNYKGRKQSMICQHLNKTHCLCPVNHVKRPSFNKYNQVESKEIKFGPGNLTVGGVTARNMNVGLIYPCNERQYGSCNFSDSLFFPDFHSCIGSGSTVGHTGCRQSVKNFRQFDPFICPLGINRHFPWVTSFRCTGPGRGRRNVWLSHDYQDDLLDRLTDDEDLANKYQQCATVGELLQLIKALKRSFRRSDEAIRDLVKNVEKLSNLTGFGCELREGGVAFARFKSKHYEENASCVQLAELGNWTSNYEENLNRLETSFRRRALLTNTGYEFLNSPTTPILIFLVSLFVVMLVFFPTNAHRHCKGPSGEFCPLPHKPNRKGVCSCGKEFQPGSLKTCRFI